MRAFSIPVTVDPKQRSKTREMLLWASDDMGESWKRSGKTDPDHPSFYFRAPRDGEYWFAVQTVNKDGGFWPAGDRPVQPAIKVIVDSNPPTVTLESRGRRGSLAAVQWEVQDEHLDLRSLVLEYQAEGVRDWRQVPLARDEGVRIGYKSWDAGTAEALRVRLSIRDFAGNTRSVDQGLADGMASEPNPNLPETRVSSAPPPVTPISNRSAPTPSADSGRADPFDAVDAAPTPASLPPPESAPPAARPKDRAFEESPGPTPEPTPTPETVAPARRQMLLVKSPRFPLKYEVTDAGPAGPALVELWVTRDGGRNWNRQAEDADHQSPYNVDLGNEGTFGLWLVVQSAAGLGELPPAPGDTPQMWVEVDSTPPAVTVDRPKIGTGKNAGKVAIDWKADDAHPGPHPISLYYRPSAPTPPGSRSSTTSTTRAITSGRSQQAYPQDSTSASTPSTR